jgi:hypothetical protein
VRIWAGRLPSRQIDWATASEYLDGPVEGRVIRALDDGASPYHARFRQGATLVPRMLVTVEERPRGPLGVAAGQIRVRSARSPNEKQPWKTLPSLEGIVESRFVRPMHLGATNVA